MNEERLRFQGRLAETEIEAKKADIAARGMLNSLRNLLDPFEPLAELKDELILDQALRLASLLVEYRRRGNEIAALKRALGR